MAQRNNKKRKERQPIFDDLSPAAKQGIGAVLFGVLGVFFILSSLDYAGRAGEVTHGALKSLFGLGFVLAPIACFMYLYALMKPRENGRTSTSKLIGITISFISILGLFSLYAEEMGGYFGWFVEGPLIYLFNSLTAGITLFAMTVIGLLLTFNVGFSLPKRTPKEKPVPEDELDLPIIGMPDVEPEEIPEQPEESTGDESAEPKKQSLIEKMGLSASKAEFIVTSFSGRYDPPPLSLLERDKGKARSADTKASSNIIKRTLQNFGIEVEMDEVTIGPSVTRYALKPAEGVRIAKIVGLQSNLELALAASPLRIEAPIPGKSLVGIEVPNVSKATVGLASILSTPEYTDSPKPLLVALGRNIANDPIFANIAKMPHMLIAGATNAGKSVTMHALITSLLFRNSPDQLRFIMVDPKRVELTNYNGIPHLLTPVIVDAKKTILALKYAIKEMERRYEILETEGVRDIDTYHHKIYQPERKKYDALDEEDQTEEVQAKLPEPMPYIVIFIDELADLMQMYPRELEASIVRLTQKSRAVGIHLIIATQRPEVKVITGLIKANVPGRIALRVNSQIDSRTILDQSGAEKLLGAGDMLFLSPDNSKTVRLQSAYISDDELKRVVSYLKNQADAHTLETIDLTPTADKSDVYGVTMDDDGGDDDDLYEEAKQIVISSKKASTSYLQRRLGIGYSRAARLIDILEERKVIGPGQGSKPRDILVEGGGGTGEPTDETASEDENSYT